MESPIPYTACTEVSSITGELLLNTQIAVKVVLNKSHLSWSTLNANYNDDEPILRVPLNEIVFTVSCDQGHKLQPKSHSFKNGVCNAHCFVVSCIKRLKSFKWATVDYLFQCQSAEEASFWTQNISSLVDAACPTRPKRLLVLLNPKAGYKKAQQVYSTIAEPLFRSANIDVEVIVTEYAGQTTEYLSEEKSVDKFDGVICVGGDGFLAEAVQGLLLRERIKAKLSQHQPGQFELANSIRLGCVPAGSTDSVVFSTNGTNDALTAVLHIIVGDEMSLDVIAVHSGPDKQFVRYGLSMIACGFFADLLKRDNRFRWMGPARYNLLGFSEFLKHSVYSGCLSYLPTSNQSSHPKDGILCSSNCSVCCHNETASTTSITSNHSTRSDSETSNGSVTSEQNKPNGQATTTTTPDDDDDAPKWQSIEGRFVCINAFLLSCRCAKALYGAIPSAHLADGCFDLLIVNECSRAEFLTFLIRLGRCSESFIGHLDLPFVSVVRARAFEFEPAISQSEETEPLLTKSQSNASPVWCSDGEVEKLPSICCFVHRKLLRVFARGPEESNPKSVKVLGKSSALS